MDYFRILFIFLFILSNHTIITYGVYLLFALIENFLRYYIDDDNKNND